MERGKDALRREGADEPRPPEGPTGSRFRPPAEEAGDQREESEKRLDLRVRTLHTDNDEFGGH